MSNQINAQDLAGPLAASSSYLPAGHMPARLFPAPAVSRKDRS